MPRDVANLVKTLKDKLDDKPKGKKVTPEKIQKAALALAKDTQAPYPVVEQQISRCTSAPDRIAEAAEARHKTAKKKAIYANRKWHNLMLAYTEAKKEINEKRDEAIEKLDNIYGPQLSKYKLMIENAKDMCNGSDEWRREHTTKAVKATIQRLAGERTFPPLE